MSEIAGRSPALRAEIAGLTFGKTVRSVWYFIGVSDDFTAEVLPRKRSEAQSYVVPAINKPSHKEHPNVDIR